MSPRYAIYWAPAWRSPWWNWGAHWLGRDESGDLALDQPPVEGFTAAELRQITTDARRYGLHATMKAPFRLADGVSAAEVWERLCDLVRGRRPFPLGPLQVTAVEGFLALTCANVPPELLALANDCVLQLDDLRAPLSGAELAHRQRHGLDARGRELVALHGYERVLERFVWHVTLSDRASQAQLLRLQEAAASAVQRLNRQEPLVVDRLSLFVEPSPGAALRRLQDVEFGA